MGIYTEPISTIKNRLSDWLQYNTVGSNVSDLALDLLNRANQWLQMYRQWDMLVTTTTLTLTNKSATLPTDIKSILEVYVDTTGIGKPTIYYYEDCVDVAQRYTKTYAYASATGGVWTITFPSVSPMLSTNPTLKYVKLLADFTGTGTEYSFFPPELLLRCAQKIHCEEKGLTGDTVTMIMASFRENLSMFENQAQFNNQMPDLTPKNRWGNPIKMKSLPLNGLSTGGYTSPLTPAQVAALHGY